MLWRLSRSDLWCTLAHWQQSPLWAVIALGGNFISKQYYILWSNWIPLTAIVTVGVMLHQRQLHIKIWVWQAVTTEVQLIKRSIFMTVLQIATGCTQSQSDEAKRNFIARRKRRIPKSGQPHWRSLSAASKNFVHKISVASALYIPTRWPRGRCHKPFTKSIKEYVDWMINLHWLLHNSMVVCPLFHESGIHKVSPQSEVWR